MFTRIKQWLRSYLFADEERELKLKLELAETQKVIYEQKLQSADLTALVREHFKGFDPRTVHLNLEIIKSGVMPSIYEGMSDTERVGFIGDVYNLYKSPALQKVIEHLAINQMLYGFMLSKSVDELNFNRMSTNGLSLLQDQLKEIAGAHIAQNQDVEEFDKFSVT